MKTRRSPFDGPFGRGPFGTKSGTTLRINYVDLSFTVSAQPYTVPGPSTIFVSDSSDDGSGFYELTLVISDGNLTLSGVTGLSFTVGDGTADTTMTFTGTIADINSALNGLVINGATVGAPTITIPFGPASSPGQISKIVNLTVTSTDSYIQALFAASENGAWYDPSDFTTMFTDDGVTNVTATGQSVYRINDKSGRGNHLRQATSTKRPTLEQDGSGKYYLSFDGTDDFMSTSSAIVFSTDEMTAWSGIYKTSDANVGVIFESGTDVTATNGTIYLASAAGAGVAGALSASRGTSLSTNNYSNASVGATIKFTLAAKFDISAATNNLLVNGTSVQTSATSQGGGTYSNSQTLYVGSRAGTSRFFNGRLYQLVIRNATTSGTTYTDAESFINEKTGAY